MALRETLQRILTTYSQAKTASLEGHPLAQSATYAKTIPTTTTVIIMTTAEDQPLYPRLSCRPKRSSSVELFSSDSVI
jgi:hypothetical protein